MINLITNIFAFNILQIYYQISTMLSINIMPRDKKKSIICLSPYMISIMQIHVLRNFFKNNIGIFHNLMNLWRGYFLIHIEQK